jgi:hypothetical protein
MSAKSQPNRRAPSKDEVRRASEARLELVGVGQGGGREDGEDASEAAGDEEGRGNLVARALILLLNLKNGAFGGLGFAVLPV